MKKIQTVLTRCVYAFNAIPNKQLKTGPEKFTTYQLASEIDKALEAITKLKEDNTLVMAILSLACYRDSFEPSQVGYIETDKIINQLTELFDN